MTHGSSLTVALLVLACPAGRAADPASPRAVARKDLEKLQGTWVLVSMEVEGQDAPPEVFKGWHAVYEGDALTLKAGEQVRRRGIVTLDPTQTPKAINTWDGDGPFEDETTQGIYDLEGDRLKLCFARPGQKRPHEFTTTKGTGFLSVVYERGKP